MVWQVRSSTAAILLRIAYAVFPEVDWGFVFVDDFGWLLRESSSSLLATSPCLLLLALGTPLCWKKTLLAEVNTWLGFVIDPKGPCVQMARDKHLLVMGILEELKSGKVMSASQIASALGRLQWATTACPLSKPFLKPFWAWKKAYLTAGRPGKLIRALSALLLSLFDLKFRQASPYAPLAIWSGASDASASDYGSAFVGGWLSNAASPSKSEVFWFHCQVTPEDHPWAFDRGCPKKRIAALEMFGTLVLAHFLMEKAPAFIPNLRIPLVSDSQGTVYSLLNDTCKKMPTSVILMEILLQLLHGMQLAPSHVKRDFNTWADELTRPDFHHGFTPSPMGPRRAPGEDVAASCTGFSVDGTNFGACFWFGKGPRTPGAVGPEGGDPPLATARFWSVTARYSTERILLGVGSHTYPPCKKGRPPAWCLVCHFHADI